MSIRIIINGARGKMGQQAVQAMHADAEFKLAAATGKEHDLAAEIRRTKADVVLDLTRADVVYHNLVTILQAGARAVIGTSGLTAAAIDRVKKEFFSGAEGNQDQRKKTAAFIVPNFSLGAVLMMKYAREIGRYFPAAEIIEMHHAGKLDAPSGTAIRTAELLAQQHEDSGAAKKTAEKNAASTANVYARGTNAYGIHIHSVRLPGLLAHQEIIFGGSGEILSLRHDTTDRICFMPGLILACKKVMKMDGIVIGLEQVL